jgi:multiple sugar transport system permease protein
MLLFFALVFLFPFAWMVTTSLKELPQAVSFPPKWIPDPVRWANYAEATSAIPFWRYAANTLFLCVFCVVGTLLSCTLAAYSLACIPWRGRGIVFMLTLGTMMIPAPVMIVPVYTIFRDLGWIGTLLPLWVPMFFGGAYWIFLLRQFFLTIPGDLREAAEIDGAGHVLTMVHVILPLARPAIMVVALFMFLFVWNDFMGPLIYLSDQAQFTLALGLQHFQSKHGGTDINLLMAASTLVVAPVVVLFFFTQRTFIEGIAMSGLKG